MPPRRATAKCYLSSVVYLSFALYVFVVQRQLAVIIRRTNSDNLTKEASAKERTNTSHRRDICPSAVKLFHNVTELRLAIEENTNFHQRGGNLHSIESYLNSHQQSTLDALGIQFLPDGEKNPANNAIQHLSEYYKNHQIKRGGYGQPLPGKLLSKNNDNQMIKKALFENRWINVLEPPSRQRYFAGAGPVGPTCSHKISFSEGTYEEKTLCLDVSKNNQDEQQPQPLCNIFSIGSNDQWGFEIEVHEKMLGCTTHTFDCTLKDNLARKKPESDSYKFYPYCIGSNDDQPPYLSYTHLVKATQINVAPKLLKMDVEGFEYDVLDSVFSADPTLWPEQIMMEVHWATRMVALPWMTRTRTAGEIALFFGMLFNHGGYILVSTRVFDGCEPCMEVLLVKALC